MSDAIQRSATELVIVRKVRGLPNKGTDAVECWLSPDEGAMPSDILEKYLRRKRAVQMYLVGETDGAINRATGLHLSHVYKLIRERCLELHPDGTVMGWRGLVPCLRIRPYIRKKPITIHLSGRGASGAMQMILDLHPDLRRAFVARILHSPPPGVLGPARRPRKAHWVWFLSRLKELGYEARNEWPFNTQTRGYNSVCRFVNQTLNENPEKGAKVLGGPDLARKQLTGDGVDRPVTRIYQRVEMDAHKIDGRFCVLLPLPSGGYTAKIVHRLWVIVIVEVVSRAVLGYHLSFNREVTADDVLRTIKKSLTRWTPMPLSFGEAYLEHAGFPSGLSDKFFLACWDEICVDGALAEQASRVVDTLHNVIGAQLLTPANSFAVRRSRDDRPYVEAFFRHLGMKGFQRFSNSTGGRPGRAIDAHPDQVAITSQFQVELAEELIDVLIANYNATPHSSLGGRSPLEFLRFIEERGQDCLRYADLGLAQAILSYRKKCRVRGGLKEGHRPYVNFEGARYSNEILASRYDLAGDYIWVVNHLEDDARVAKASTLDGLSLGVLRASPPWHQLPHSLAVRRAINSCIRRQLFAMPAGMDAVDVFLDYVEEQSRKKLPIHPGYLEARRILFAATHNRSLTPDSPPGRLASSPPDSSQDGGKIKNKESSSFAENTLDRPAAGGEISLPARRMTAS